MIYRLYDWWMRLWHGDCEGGYGTWRNTARSGGCDICGRTFTDWDRWWDHVNRECIPQPTTGGEPTP